MKLLALLSLTLVTLATAGAAQAADQYPKVYDANYALDAGGSKSSLRMTSDGKGKLRSESKSAAYKVISIIDYPGKTTYSIMEAQKMVMKMPLKDAYISTVSELIAKKKGKDLGNKTIAGRVCHGCSYTDNGSTTEMWVDEKDRLVVQSTTKTGKTATTMTLISATSNAPSADLFVIPKTYKVQAM